MGRPISKRFLGDTAGAIKVSHYRRSTGSEVAGDDNTYIKSQKTTKKFVVADADGNWSEILTLVDKAVGSLAAGEFRISATDPEGDDAHVSRLYNRTLRIGDGAGEKRKVGWDIDVSDSISVTGVTLDENDPVVILINDTSRINNGDSISFTGVLGATELNARRSTTVANVVENTSFEIMGSDNTEVSSYTGGGEIVTNPKIIVTGLIVSDPDPVVVLTDNTDGAEVGDSITFTGFNNNARLNNTFTIGAVTPNVSITLQGTNSAAHSAWSSGGIGTISSRQIRVPLVGVTLVGPTPVKIEVSDTSHFEKGDVVKFSNINGTTVLNDENDEYTFTVGDIVENTSFTLAGTAANGSNPTFNTFTRSSDAKVFVTGKAAIDRQDA